ncbi:MAG: hypothetical protein V3573_08330 [Desulfovibrionaceae bacterium]
MELGRELRTGLENVSLEVVVSSGQREAVQRILGHYRVSDVQESVVEDDRILFMIRKKKREQGND